MTASLHVLTDGRKDSDKDAHADVHVDGHVDVQTDVSTDVRTDRHAYVIVLANHKGGVTKTTSTANLGALLAEAGRRVLIVIAIRRRTCLRRSGGLRRSRGRGS